jgi:hypothetical protein
VVHGEARYRTEQGLTRMRTPRSLDIGERWAVSRDAIPASARKALDPCSRLSGVPGVQDDDSLVDDREHETASGSLGKRSEKLPAFDEKHGETAVSAQSSDLAPESSVRERKSKVGGGLALDERASANVVITDGQRLLHNLHAEFPELTRDGASRLVDIHGHSDGIHTCSMVAGDGSAIVALLAFSRREKA